MPLNEMNVMDEMRGVSAMRTQRGEVKGERQSVPNQP